MHVAVQVTNASVCRRYRRSRHDKSFTSLLFDVICSMIILFPVSNGVFLCKSSEKLGFSNNLIGLLIKSQRPLYVTRAGHLPPLRTHVPRKSPPRTSARRTYPSLNQGVDLREGRGKGFKGQMSDHT